MGSLHHIGPASGRAPRATAALLVAALALGAVNTSAAQQRDRDVLLGGLFPLTGAWSTKAQTLRAAMEMAVEDVNRYLEGNAAGIRFVAAIEDTRLDPAVALEKARALHRRGAQLLIGPHSSAEVAHIKPFVDANGVLVVSPASTAGSLAIVGDNIFRFIPSDSLEGVAISALMWDDGVRVIVPVWRDDAGGVGLEHATRARFTALGGTVLEGVTYDPGTRDYRATVAAVGTQVRRAMALYGASGTSGTGATSGASGTDRAGRATEVAVYIAGFGEVASVFVTAGADPVLSSIRWYGSDGAAHSDSLLANRRAAAFAIHAGFPNPVFGLDEGARDIWAPLAARIRARTNVEPDAFALAIYDAVWVVARGYVASGATLNIDQLKHAFTTAASTQFGATGWTVLNAAGDRKYGDFDFWAVREVNGQPAWTRVAKYETRTGRVVRDVAPLRASLAVAPLSLADIAGRWNIRAVPETGETTATTPVLNATADATGWTMIYPPNRDPIPVRVIAVAGDSIVFEWGPYLSARRAGLKAVSRDVYRLIDGRLVGYSRSHYVTAPEVVIHLRLEATRAP
jgi:branched-chain amino acid transport system substrate-binding protein